MSYFPNNYFDCVTTVYCPIGILARNPSSNSSRSNQYIDVIKTIHRITKKNGIIYFPELRGLFYWLLNKEKFNHMVKNIDEILGEKNIADFRKENDDEPDEENFYAELITNYQGPKRKLLRKYIDKISFRYTIKFLTKNNFSFVKEKGEIIVAKPIK